MKRSDWIDNAITEPADPAEGLAAQIIEEIDWIPADLSRQEVFYLKEVVEANREYFERNLRPKIAKALHKVSNLGTELSIYSEPLCRHYLLIQLWRTSQYSLTLNVIFHPGILGINCISTFRKNKL